MQYSPILYSILNPLSKKMFYRVIKQWNGEYRRWCARRAQGHSSAVGFSRLSAAGCVEGLWKKVLKIDRLSAGGLWQRPAGEGKQANRAFGAREMQSSRDYSSLSHHRTYRSVYGGSILWADYHFIALF